MSIHDKPVASQLQGGLNKDYTFKPAAYTSFVLNGIRDSHDGGKTQYQSEPGNTIVESLPSDNTIVGWIYGQNNEIYLFSSIKLTGLSEVGIFKNGFYNTVFQADLGFDPRYPITGEYRLKNGCERIIYWCDGSNPDYFFNFDRPELFKDDLDQYDPNLFRLIPKVLPPKIDLVSVNDSGGNLPLGSYYFQVELLDNTLNSIYKTDISPQTPIVDDSYGNVYSQIDGGLNIEQYTEEIGGVPITTKSITLRLYNLNTAFAFVRINVARQIAGTQAIDAHAVGGLIPIGSEDFTWTYTGYNVSSGDYPIDYGEMLTSNVRYDTAYVMEQVQGRLVRAALKQDIRDYSTYQRNASSIDVRWYSEEILKDDVTQLGNEKNPETYWLKTNMQGDEIYALAIQYLHDDGTWSPMFHIPGKPPISSDRTILTVVDNANVLGIDEVWESDVQHLDQSEFTTWSGTHIGSTIEEWKVFNTATYTNTISGTHPFIHEGKMGFYEGLTTYPDIRDCDNALIWGQDSSGNNITEETKIRHHRMPDRNLIAIVTGDQNEYIRSLGLKFRNITYPNSNIVGHRFGYVVRDEINKTVLDSGWFAKTQDDLDLVVGPSTEDIFGVDPRIFISANENIGGFGMLTGLYGQYISGDILFNNKAFTPDYLKFNKVYNIEFNKNIGDVVGSTEISVQKTGGGNIVLTLRYAELDGFSYSPRKNHFKIDKQIILNPQGFNLISLDRPVKNPDQFSKINVIKTISELENYNVTIDTDKQWCPYIYKKQNVKPYNNLFNLQYKYLNFNYNDSTDHEDNIYYNGDTLISKSVMVRKITTDMVHIYTFFYGENPINFSLRHGGTQPFSYYFKDYSQYFELFSKISVLQDDGSWDQLAIENIIPEHYAYNKDFNKQNIDTNKQAIPITYNYCSDCIGEFSSRIVFSPKSFDEETFDLYRINKLSDYIDLPGHRGQITGLKYKNNVLLTHCKEGTFMLQPNPQAISTNISDIYLTTGDFLGLPPSELMQTDVGYAGCQSKQHQCDTPNGWCWTDQLRSQIFKFNGKLEEISNQGMTQWFNDNLPSELQDSFYEVFQEEYTTPSTLAIENNGIGLIMYYDPKYNRLLITKKDFLPIGFRDRSEYIGDLTYDFDNAEWKGVNRFGETVTVYFNDVDWFENKSWTLSYSFDYAQGDLSPWTSWHSYIPPFAFWDNFYYYTMPVQSEGFNVHEIYRHNHEGSYQTYYNSKYDFIIEWMDYSPITRDFNSIHYNGYTLQWDSDHKQWIQNNDVTFNKGMFYTYNQSTGLVDLRLVNQHTDPYTKISMNNLEKTIVRTDNNFKITGLYDIAVTLPVVTSQWADIQENYYIDKVVNNLAVEYNKSPYELGNIRDKFIISRLYFNTEGDYKKVVNIVQNHNSTSIR